MKTVSESQAGVADEEGEMDGKSGFGNMIGAIGWRVFFGRAHRFQRVAGPQSQMDGRVGQECNGWEGRANYVKKLAKSHVGTSPAIADGRVNPIT